MLKPISSIKSASNKAIQAQENLMEPMLEAVRAYATVGEIVELMKEEYGTWGKPEIF